MPKKGNLMSFRPDIKVLDATLRDGGLVNDFYFTDEFVKDIYKANIDAGVDYMEFGYRADKDLFDEDKFGKWKFATDDDIREVVGDNDTSLKLSIMADVGRCNYKRDIHPKNESPVDLIRVACYIHQIPAAIAMIEDAHNKGYETTCNIMAITNAQRSDLADALEMLGETPVNGIYIVDSYGALFPEQVREITDLYMESAEKNGKYIGMHAHNNQQLAFANTIESCAQGASYLDATYSSMGRGAGNCSMELLMAFLKNPKYSIFPVLKFVEKHMVPLVQDPNVLWGYDIPYLLTGHLNQHPRTAIAATGEHRTDYINFYKELIDKD
ncbi:MAG: aldolase catalytic domain-containing protein [Lachnospiraceae bacterium]|nr:aldolase catalytic domain-containing protein [Lachnospiraceae bacterium]